jgi:hypothetical protein
VGNKATHGVLLERAAHPGVYRRGAQYVAVYRRVGRQRKESAAIRRGAGANYWRNSSQPGREGVLVSGAQARADSHRLLLYDPFR